jgi:hypothetical protein
VVDSAELCRNTHPDRLIICEILLVVRMNIRFTYQKIKVFYFLFLFFKLFVLMCMHFDCFG